jgi:hypothetical protein
VKMGTNTPMGCGRQSPGIELDRLFAFGSKRPPGSLLI